MDFVDISTSGYDPNVHQNISYEQAMEVMHVIGKDGEVHASYLFSHDKFEVPIPSL